MTVMRPLACIVPLLVLACGRVDYDADAVDAGRDASLDAALDATMDAPSDAPSDVPRDAVLDVLPDVAADSSLPSTFGPPELVAGLVDPTGSVTNPTLTLDELEVFVVRRSSRGSAGDIWTATRTSASLPFGAMTRVSELNSGGDESGLHLSRDGLTLWFASIRSGGLGDHDIYRGTRPARGMPFSSAVQVVEASTSMNESSPAVDESQTVLVLNRGTSPRDLHEARRPSTSVDFSAATIIPSLSHPDDDAAPELSPDGRTLYFASTRPGGLGGSDLWTAQRATLGVAFDPPMPMTELNSPGGDSVPWISADARTIYFASDRDGTTAIYRAVR